ncbi:MAG: hypothetical protein IKR61_02490 [Lachnospiraceae bacterium]|nr:hypothetical protein [Lachnospiraceae bacterium]
MKSFSVLMQEYLTYTSGAKLTALFLTGLLAALAFPQVRKEAGKENRPLLIASGALAVLCLFPPTALLLSWYQSAYYDYRALWSMIPVLPVTALFLTRLFAWILCRWQKEGIHATAFREKYAPPLLLLVLLLLLLLCGDAGYQSWRSYALPGDRATLEELTNALLEQSPEGSDRPVVWGPREVMTYLPMVTNDLRPLYGRDFWDPSLDGFTYDTYPDSLQDLYDWMYAVELQDVFFFAFDWDSLYYTDAASIAEARDNKNGIQSCRAALDAGVDYIVLPGCERTDRAALSYLAEELSLQVIPVRVEEDGYYILFR